MRIWKRMCVGSMLASVLSGCMGTDGTLVNFGSQAGVVRLDDGKQIVLRNGMTILAPQLDTLQVSDGDCCLVDFQLNYDDQPDSLQNIWHANWLVYHPVRLHGITPLEVEDTTITRLDEHFLDFSISAGGCVEDRLFLYMEYNEHYQSQTDEFLMCYDPDPTLRHWAADSVHRVHQLYLRSYGSIAAGDTITEELVLPEAFLLEELVSRAEAAGEDTLHFHITYPSRYNDDSSRYVWTFSDMFSVPLSR